MYTDRMTLEELERLFYITGDARHATLVQIEENLQIENIESLNDQITDAERERDQAADDEQIALDDRDRMEDERNEAIEERDRLRAENNTHVAEILRLRAAPNLSEYA